MDDLNFLRQLFLSASAEAAWKEFLRRYSNLFLKVIWQFDKNRDKVMDTYLYVCKRFADNEFEILRKFRMDYGKNPPKLSTWLGAVVRNMCIDYYRVEHGRRRYPRSILQLPDFERKVFELHFWRGHSVEEIEHQLGVRKSGSVPRALQRVEKELTRPPLRQQADDTFVPYDETTMVVDSSFSQQEELLDLVDGWLKTLEPRERLIVRLKFWENMKANEIASVLRIQGQQKVYSILRKALKKLKVQAAKERR